MDFLQLMQQRYTTKHYDSSFSVDDASLAKILECARLTPTACNLQPYHFFVATGEAKARLRPAVKDFNLSRYDESSHVIVISSYKRINEEHFKAVLQAEVTDGRLPTEELQQAQDSSRRGFSQMHIDRNDFPTWCAKQAYIAFASIVYAAESLGIDSTAVEGIEEAKVDEILDLDAKDLACQMIVLLGKRSEKDSNVLSNRPKSRLAKEQVITVL